MSACTRRVVALALSLGILACTRSAAPVAASPIAIQAAAVGFLAQANADRGACVLVAANPGEPTRGRVTGDLRDPSPSFTAELTAQRMTGVLIRPFSACSATEREKVTYAIGWPRRTSRGFEVNADRLCGARCGEGTLILIRDLGTGWRAVEAETTWRS